MTTEPTATPTEPKPARKRPGPKPGAKAARLAETIDRAIADAPTIIAEVEGRIPTRGPEEMRRHRAAALADVALRLGLPGTKEWRR